MVDDSVWRRTTPSANVPDRSLQLEVLIPDFASSSSSRSTSTVASLSLIHLSTSQSTSPPLSPPLHLSVHLSTSQSIDPSITIMSNFYHYHYHRNVYAAHSSATSPFAASPPARPTSPATLPRIQTLFPETKWAPSPPPLTSLAALVTGVESHCRSPPTYPYRKCVLDVAMTPTRTILKRIETPVAKPRKPLSLFDLLSVDAALSAAEKKSCKPSVHHRRQCGVPDCVKYALSGGFCIRHGGGKRCSYEGCQTVAQSGGLCKAHGGGSKCKVENCCNVARRKGFCMSHGGRQPCKVDGCSKCAHGGGYCISHGGGKRCASLDCVKNAQAGGFCYSHGGGKRCSAPQCFQAARKGGLCIRHRKAFNYVGSSSINSSV